VAFKKTIQSLAVPDSPEELLLDLPRRKIPGVLLHQGEIMRTYATSAAALPDVALQSPTGSGKTLVGLLIAEWRRRKFGERVVYLCPTRQLVNQAVEQADDQYGLSVTGFTGKVSGYTPSARTQYLTAERVAVTTYSGLFNSNPFFDSPDVIILDDAHAAENYIAKMWTLRVDRREANHSALHAALAITLKPLLDPSDYARLTEPSHSLVDRAWLEKIPGPSLSEIQGELTAVLDSYADVQGIQYPWKLLRGHLSGCHLYMSADEILIRPLIPPTWTHGPFQNAKQRIYMSATLGQGGDLERLTGRRHIRRLPIPKGWDRHGIGRRFFLFPGLSLDDAEADKLRLDLMRRAGRSVVLVPDDRRRQVVATEVKDKLGFATFDATAMEASKKPFIENPNAVAVVANRYDGIDFPGDSCRLLFVEGVPNAMNLQERFISARMGASILLNDRVQTRVLQAIGRCTRSAEDFSAVVVSGEELPDYLVDQRRSAFFHAELQAELKFGITQSKETTAVDMLENVDIFLKNGAEWEEANKEILVLRDGATRSAFPAVAQLEEVVQHEIDFQDRMWHGDPVEALERAGRVLGGLNAPELRGYRALWEYLAGSAAWLASRHGSKAHVSRSLEHFRRAKGAAGGLAWLATLSRFEPDTASAPEKDAALKLQVERCEGVLLKLGTLNDRAFRVRERSILEGLADPARFEQAQVELGDLLGFDTGKKETDASPDPWWIIGNICLVFEDHAGAAETSLLDATKARQAASHPDWMRVHVPAAANAEIVPVLVTPVTQASSGTVPQLPKIALWSVREFQQWATKALEVIRMLRTKLGQSGDIAWRAEAMQIFEQNGIDAPSLFAKMKANTADKGLKIVG
jgi:hypothetical protein